MKNKKSPAPPLPLISNESIKTLAKAITTLARSDAGKIIGVGLVALGIGLIVSASDNDK